MANIEDAIHEIEILRERVEVMRKALREIRKATEADEDDIFLPLSGDEAQRIYIKADEALTESYKY